MSDSTELDAPPAAAGASLSSRPSAFGPREAVDAGRIGVYTALGGAVGLVPLPWLPGALARRVRGAIVQDVADRYGITLSRDARDVLVRPGGAVLWPKGFLGEVARFASTKVLARFGPLALVTPLKSGVETFALGHLFVRYLEMDRPTRARRIEAAEARVVRVALDRAVLHALTVDPGKVRYPSTSVMSDERDPMTAVIDRILIGAAGIPGWLVDRLDAAFDDLVASAAEP